MLDKFGHVFVIWIFVFCVFVLVVVAEQPEKMDFLNYERLIVEDEINRPTKKDWKEYIARRLDQAQSHYKKRTKIDVPTSAGPMVDIVWWEKAWQVEYDHEAKTYLADCISAAIAIERDPGMILLCPDGRTEHYHEIQAIAQYLRSYGVPLSIMTVAIPVKKDEDFDDEDD